MLRERLILPVSRENISFFNNFFSTSVSITKLILVVDITLIVPIFIRSEDYAISDQILSLRDSCLVV